MRRISVTVPETSAPYDLPRANVVGAKMRTFASSVFSNELRSPRQNVVALKINSFDICRLTPLSKKLLRDICGGRPSNPSLVDSKTFSMDGGEKNRLYAKWNTVRWSLSE